MEIKENSESLEVFYKLLNNDLTKDQLYDQLAPHLKSNKIEKNDFLLIEKIAKNTTFQEFELFTKKGELPILKLSNKEIQSIKGGSIGASIAIAAAVAYSRCKDTFESWF